MANFPLSLVAIKDFRPDKIAIHPLLAAFAYPSDVSRVIEQCDSAFLALVSSSEFEVIFNYLLKSRQLRDLFRSYPISCGSLKPHSQHNTFILECPFSCPDYKLLYPDMQELSDSDAEAHYYNIGAKYEHRSGSLPSYLFDRLKDGNCLRPHCMDPMNAYDLGLDYVGKDHSWSGIHVAHSAKALTYSVENKNLPNQNVILFHVYYPEEIPYYLPVIESAINSGYQLYVSLPLHMKMYQVRSLLKYSPHFSYVPNIGRDVLGFYSSYTLARYNSCNSLGAVLLIHTKKSPHVHEHYRRFWVDEMIGWMQERNKLEKLTAHILSGQASQIAGAACKDFGFGSVPPKYFSDYPSSPEWPYASGIMSLVASSVLDQTLLKFSFDDYSSNPVVTTDQHLCGGIPHAIERLISYEAYIQNGILWV